MAKKKTGLGRGFESLIPTHIVESEFDPTAKSDKSISRTKNVFIQDVVPNPSQPRKVFDKSGHEELVMSIKTHGIIQPLIVTDTPEGYKIIAGERRYRAAKDAGLKEIPVVIRSYDDQAALEVALIENLQREDLNALEVATAFFKLVDQFNLSHEHISQRTGKSVSAVKNTVRLLGLPRPAKDALLDGKITEGHARQILALKDPKKQQELLDLILRHNWTVRRSEQFVTAYKEGAKDHKQAVQASEKETAETKQLAKYLMTKVMIRPMAKGGRLIIEYKSKKDLDRITKNMLKK